MRPMFLLADDTECRCWRRVDDGTHRLTLSGTFMHGQIPPDVSGYWIFDVLLVRRGDGWTIEEPPELPLSRLGRPSEQAWGAVRRAVLAHPECAALAAS